MSAVRQRLVQRIFARRNEQSLEWDEVETRSYPAMEEYLSKLMDLSVSHADSEGLLNVTFAEAFEAFAYGSLRTSTGDERYHNTEPDSHFFFLFGEFCSADVRGQDQRRSLDRVGRRLHQVANPSSPATTSGPARERPVVLGRRMTTAHGISGLGF